MMEDNLPAWVVMEALQLSRSTFYEWRGKYLEGGTEALALSSSVGGGVSKLTEDQTRTLRSWLIGRDPRQFQFDFALWTRGIVAELIRTKFEVEMTPQGVGKLLHRIGLSPQRPRYRATKQDPEAVRRWREQEYPAIRAKAQAMGAQIYFGDEAGIRSDHHAGTTWAPVGATPVVEVTGDRTTVNMISAVSPTGELKFSVFNGGFNSTVFVEFCKKLVADTDRPVFLILDNLSVHKSKIVTDYVKTTDGRLTLFFLPPYSPELNPDEWVWKNVKNDRIGRAGIRRASDLFDLAHRALERLVRTPEIVRGFFGDPCLAYISTTKSASPVSS